MPLVLSFRDPESGRPRSWSVSGVLRVGNGTVDADLVLDLPSIAPLHAELDGTNPAAPTIRALHADALLAVNGRVCQCASLGAGDRVDMGEARMLVSAGPPPAGLLAAATKGPRGQARGTVGPDAGKAAPDDLAAGAPQQVAPTLAGPRPTRAGPAASPLQARRTERSAGRQNPAVLAVFGAVGAVAVLVAVAWISSMRKPVPVQRTLSEAEIIRKALAGIVMVQVKVGQEVSLGSGVVVSKRGHIVTNLHVLGEAAEAEAIFENSEMNPVVLVRSDEWNDLALLRLKHPRETSYLELADDLPGVGDNVYAVGSPLSPELGFSVTRGIISSRQRELVGRLFIQHDAAINPGNSGGPLLDARGQVLGLNTWKITQADGMALQGLGFAIPAKNVNVFLKKGHELD